MTKSKTPSIIRGYFVTDDASPSIFQKIVAESLGTYALVFVGCGSILTNEIQRLTIVGIALTWGLVLMAAIYALAHISGAHFNPAVSLALAFARKFPLKHVPAYVLAQLFGAILASLTLRVLYTEQDIELTLTQYKDSTSHLQAFVWEFITTFILMFCISAVATDHRATKDVVGVAIGGTVMFNVLIAGPISGASLNPARSIAPAIVSGVYKNIWVYITSPILGALAAVFVYSTLRVPEPEKAEEDNKSMHV